MNAKPADQQTNPRYIQKLQNFDGPIEGNLVEVSQSKMGTPIYRIRRDFDLVSIYGFNDLDEQMKPIRSGSLIRIVYLGSNPTRSGRIRHLAKVDLIEDVAANSIVATELESAQSYQTPTSQSQRMRTLIHADGPINSDASFRFLRKLGILK
ncbi:MAG: hypothetical protein JNJ49_08550 [Bdellovibrionaceae bacterium]|nr:hypothetical protein [Pseudobdellovibrionaceae bacterium]